MRNLLIVLALLLPVSAWSQSNLKGLAALPQERICIEACDIESTTSTIHAKGSVLFQFGQKRLTADEVFYCKSDNSGRLSQAAFTTCDLPNPDYRITADEILLTPEQRLKLKGVRVYLGNVRLIRLPSMSINVGPGAGRQVLFPRPGYSGRDGFFLTSSFALRDTDKSELNLLFRPTTKAGIQGGVYGGYAIRGNALVEPPYIPESDMELRSQSILRPMLRDSESAFCPVTPQPELIAAFGSLLFNERVYDVNNPDLQVTSEPEIGLHYVSPQVCALTQNGIPAMGLQVESRASWGRFKETPGTGFHNRLDARGLATTTLTSLGPSTVLRGSALGRVSDYNTGSTFSVLGGALDACQMFPGGSFTSIRLIGHLTWGSTPFEFDNVDILQELQGAGRYVRGRNSYSGLLRYDLQRGSLRDWEFTYGRRLHCLEPSVTWRNRYSQISFNLKVLGL